MSYLQKINRRFYYRIRVPSDLADLFPSKEIRKFLKTTDFKTAKSAAANLNQRVQSTFALLRSGTLGEEQITPLVTSFNSRRNPATERTPSSLLLLSRAFELYTEDRSPHWTEKSKIEFLKEFQILLKILGDNPLSCYTREDCLDCRRVLTKLPPNFSKKKEFRSKTIRTIAQSNSGKALHPKTVNKYLILLSSFFRWCSKRGNINSNPAEGLQIPVKIKADQERKAYSRDDLEKIFRLLPASEPEKYWIPLLAMHTGMRLDELCQLQVDDIKRIGNHYCIDINDNGEKNLKTISSKRVLPVHSKLISLNRPQFARHS